VIVIVPFGAQSEKQNELMKQQEMTVADKKRELDLLDEKKGEMVEPAETSALTFHQKYEKCLGQLGELQSALERLQKQQLESCQRDLEKQDQIESVTRMLESRNSEFTRLQADHARYVAQHRSTNDEVLQNEQRAAELERELKRTKQQLESSTGEAAQQKQKLTTVREQKTKLETELASLKVLLLATIKVLQLIKVYIP
jgi:chromosome segregation ATPase